MHPCMGNPKGFYLSYPETKMDLLGKTIQNYLQFTASTAWNIVYIFIEEFMLYILNKIWQESG